MDSQVSKSLVADYDSSSEEEDDDIGSKSSENQITPLASALEMLDHKPGNIPTSVFTNPYKNAENYEQSILEKHVKMTAIKNEPEAKKKICYKFRRGKCRLGDKCQYLHVNHQLVDNSDAKLSDGEDNNEAGKKREKSKKRCGLKDDLVPPKRYMKTFNKCK
ncbi:hypothetical protein JTE90_020470 [Oedothorax gibbosus]|uniref:C3H1-type domain-containing protein n=1 Tax=Oedothorax gibbosus TaxID=931172 RepID=A0AAV6U950_9ARAC|nr:hypothetical protein JTE90_020470 [Oedothorax gibbosus]